MRIENTQEKALIDDDLFDQLNNEISLKKEYQDIKKE